MEQIDYLLKEYILRDIIPQYSNADKGHGIDHVNDVIGNSLEIAKSYDVDINMVFVIASYHDVGIKFSRENHNETSAKIMLEDKVLHKWFSKDKLVIISEAIIDHRASNNYEPRTIYGKIISDADRIIDAKKLIYNTMEYGKSNFPLLSDEKQWERTYEHIQEKYGENGYMKLWLNTAKNVKGLIEIRDLLKNKEKMQEIYNKLI